MLSGDLRLISIISSNQFGALHRFFLNTDLDSLLDCLRGWRRTEPTNDHAKRPGVEPVLLGSRQPPKVEGPYRLPYTPQTLHVWDIYIHWVSGVNGAAYTSPISRVWTPHFIPLWAVRAVHLGELVLVFVTFGRSSPATFRQLRTVRCSGGPVERGSPEGTGTEAEPGRSFGRSVFERPGAVHLFGTGTRNSPK